MPKASQAKIEANHAEVMVNVALAPSTSYYVAGLILSARVKQDEEWGPEATHPDGIHGTVAQRFKAQEVSKTVRELRRENRLTWRNLIDEKLAQMDAEVDTLAFEGAAIEAAAVITAMVEDIHRRRKRRQPRERPSR